MKRVFHFSAAMLAAAFLFTACEEDTTTDNGKNYSEAQGAYVLNFGNFGDGNANITKYDYENDATTPFFYQTANSGEKLSTSAQSAYAYDSLIYIVGNSPDMILVVNKEFEKQSTITDSLANPRYIVGDGDYLYISCWGANYYPDATNSYILKYDLSSKTSEKIMLAGGPEGLAIVNNKLYAALNYANNLAVMNLSDKSIDYIETSAVSSQLLVDDNNNIYFPLHNTALGYIDTTTDKITTWDVENIGRYYPCLALSNDGKTLYAISASYDAEWNLTGSLLEFDTTNKTFASEPLATEISGINALSVNPENDDLYVFISNGVVDNGEMQIYRKGEKVDTKEVGPEPITALYLD